MEPKVERVENVTQRATSLFVDALLAGIRERGEFTTALPGGTTPLPLYEHLASRDDLPWERVQVFVGVERFVPDTHEASNFGNLRNALLDHVPVRPEHVHPWPIEDTPQASAKAYGDLLDEALRGRPFDLTLLGLGADGHTAGVFPGTDAVTASGSTRTTNPADTEHPRLTLTPRRLSESRTVAFLVSGEPKRQALDALLARDGDPMQTPARAITALEQLLVITDIDARR